MQLLGSSKKDIDQNKNGVLIKTKILARLKTVGVVSVHCNVRK